MRLRVPPLIDAVVVSNEADLARLNNEPALDRQLSGRGGWLHRLIWKRMSHTLAVSPARLLPVFESADNPGRCTAQKTLEQQLTHLAASRAPFDRDAIGTLGRYVAGDEPDVPAGVTVQQIVGRLFQPAYVATPESYGAAKVVASALSACPVTALRSLVWRWTGRFERSKTLIWTLAQYDPAAIHATAIAMHNLVDSLAKMRTAMRVDGPWHETPAEAAASALVAPPMLMREVTRETTLPCPVRPGTLVLFRLKTIHAGTDSNDLALSRNEWSQCPAHAIVPRLLEEVWSAAVRERSTRRYATRRAGALARLAAAFATPVAAVIDILVFRPGLRAFARLNRRVPWYRLPKLPASVPALFHVFTPAFLNLWALRTALRERNLHDTSLVPTNPGPPLPPAHPNVLRWRTADGSFNDLHDPTMGRAGTRFGRNVPLAETHPDTARLLDPDPLEVSRRLLTRGTFIPAPSLNVLAAAWIQFQVHDWFAHELEPQDTSPPWHLGVRRTLPDRTRADRPAVSAPTWLNTVTHWWDASQLYGSDQATQDRVRSKIDGKLRVDATGQLPTDPSGLEITGVNMNWWLGLSLFHQLFTAEHNAICDRLRADYPAWDDEQLFQTARLVNAALITKIHDLEWVPQVLGNAPVQVGLYATWWGLLGKWVATSLGRLPNSDMLSGVPGSPTDHHAAPFAITEEFVSVYRMHAFMMPDHFAVHSLQPGTPVTTVPLPDILGTRWRTVLGATPFADLLFSFGRNVPGALALGNYPAAFQQLQTGPGGPTIDLAAVDILRDRERGVPRYNRFRQLLHMPPIRTFEELNAQWAPELRRLYTSVDHIDLMIGLFAETPPPGFGFSDTTFRIFLLMNGRRLKSDRFYSADYTAAVYSQTGLDWIHRNDLRSVLLRHYPELGDTLAGGRNVFAPW